MRLSDIPQQVLQLTPDTAETAFPTRGTLAAEDLGRVLFEVWEIGSPGGYYAGVTPPGSCIDVPRVFSPGSTKTGAVDAAGVGGSVLVPVWHPVWSDWPLPPIPIVNGAPAPFSGRRQPIPLLTYPAFRVDEHGRIAVRWDQKLHALPRGRYEARVLIDGLVCGLFEIDKNYLGAVELAAMASKELVQPPPRGDKPEGLTDMFDEIYTWASVTTCQLNPGDTVVKVKDAAQLATATLCKQPQLVVTDGVTREVITFIGTAAENQLSVERSGATPIQAGAIVRFEWTPENVALAAEGC